VACAVRGQVLPCAILEFFGSENSAMSAFRCWR
jgi:hypothetical protein